MTTEGATPLSRAEAEFADRVHDFVRQLNDDETEAAARNLKPFACGEEVYYERFGRTEETERIFEGTEPREFKHSCYFGYMTPEAAAKWVDSVRREFIFQKLRKKIDPEREAFFERMTGRDDVERALRKIDPDCDRKQWFAIGAALKHEYGEAGWPLWRDWSARSKAKYPGESELRYQWDSIRGSHHKPATLGSIFFHAKEAARG